MENGIDAALQYRQQQKQNKMNKSIKKLFAFTAIGVLLVSCGGHTTCDAYSYYKYEKEKKEINNTPLQEKHIENGTI